LLLLKKVVNLAEMPNYIIIEDFTAPKKEKEGDGNRLQRKFSKGEFISGKADGYATLKGEKVHVILQDDGFVIPAKNIKQVNKNFNDDAAQAAQQMNLEVHKIVSKDFFKKTIDESKRSAKGVVIGAFSGFAYALITGRSVIWCGFLGAVAGGLAAKGLNKYINKKENENNKSITN